MYVVENKHIFFPTKSNIYKKRLSRSSSVIVCFRFTLICSFSEWHLSLGAFTPRGLRAASDHRLQERELTFGSTKTVGQVMTLRPFEAASF